MKQLTSLLVAALLVLSTQTHADEGMWLPLHIKRLNHTDMQKCGLQLTAEEIYSVNNSSLKDAVVVLNGGSCTGEIISKEGLMLTNHHCGYGVIQSHSSPEADYLTDGFWAMDRQAELPAEGMTVGFLVRMEDATKRVLEGVNDDMSGEDRAAKIRENMTALKEETKGDTHYDIQIREFFDGNEYYLFVFETFRDIRLVGAPPSSIGKYGGDTDNWMWPRHTGDFSMFRVYAGADGKPADYSVDNVPVKPRHHLPVSLNGVKKGDYAMIMGFPGSTDRYLTSHGVKLAIEKEQPTIVNIREKRLALLKEDMNSSSAIRIKYASKYAGVSNYYKYFKGQTRGLKRLRVYDKKKAEEVAFENWAAQDGKRKERYGNVMSDFEAAYKIQDEYKLSRTYFVESFFYGTESIRHASNYRRLYQTLSADGDPDPEKVNALIQGLKERNKAFFKDYNKSTDQKVFAALIEMMVENTPEGHHSALLDAAKSKYKGDWARYAADLYSKSIIVDEDALSEFLMNTKAKTLAKDPIFALMNSGLDAYRANVSPKLAEANQSMSRAQRLYAEGMRIMNPDKKYYPNANSTMRVTYGNVLDYYPRDAVHYDFYTTLEGVMEKHDPSDAEFVLPARVVELAKKKDYGQYAENGELRVNFLTNNDITGGNSGSPVINGKGELIGCAFDGNWEAMSGDIAFEHKLQRTIAVDARYILWCIDKVAGAKHLVDEMTIVRDNDNASVDPAARPDVSASEATPMKKEAATSN